MSDIRGGAQSAAHLLPVDGHVHFYQPERVPSTLDAALRNFLCVAPPLSGCAGALLLTQASHEQVFEALRASPGRYGRWLIAPVQAEEQTLVASCDAHWIALVAGSQVRCDNGLEVAAIGTSRRFPDGLPLQDAIEAVSASGAWLVLPWGFGKWAGARGRQILGVLESGRSGQFAVGDNGSRMRLLRQPALIRHAGKAGHLVLPGTDPFPCGTDYRRVGSFGFLLDVRMDTARPWHCLEQALNTLEAAPTPYGHAVSVATFLRNQIGIRLFNRRIRRTA